MSTNEAFILWTSGIADQLFSAKVSAAKVVSAGRHSSGCESVARLPGFLERGNEDASEK